MLKLANFDYQLPDDLIAQSPALPRDSSRLLKVDRQTNRITHHHFRDLPDLLSPSDVLVRNNTRVIPARIMGQKSSGGKIEVLLLKRAQLSTTQEVWECLTKPGVKPNQTIIFSPDFQASCTKVDDYVRHLTFNLAGEKLFAALNNIGQTPLPPYIAWSKDDEPELRQLYQTTYAKVSGSAAAPTAGLHFTQALDDKLNTKNVSLAEVTLHVGLGTFLPVKEEDVTQHPMHSEWFELSPATADQLNRAKQRGQRIIAVGTTTCRVLETCAVKNETGEYLLQSRTGETDIFMYPPYTFKFVDGLITNFHLPKSTLLMLISAFATVPNTPDSFISFDASLVGKAYQTAIDNHYRFYSFGDSMLLV